MKRPLPLLALLGTLVFAASAHASTTVDIRGTWDGRSMTAGGTYESTIVLTDENFATGEVVGHGQGNGYTWPEHITLTGNHYESTDGPYDQLPSYVGHSTGTVSDDGNTITGTWTDSFGQSGTFTNRRMSGGGGAPAPTPTQTPAPTPQPNPNLFKTVCVSIWIGDCAGFLPPPDPVQVCVSWWENCNGFGGMKPASPGTIDMSGFPSELVTPAECGQAPGGGRTRGAVAADKKPNRSISDNPSLRCKIETYINDSTSNYNPLDDEFQYEQNLRLFQAEADARKANIVRGLLTCSTRAIKDAKQSGDPPCRFMIGAVSIWQAGIEKLFEDAKAPGAPVTVLAPAKEAACDLLAEAQAQADCRHVASTLNSSVVTALTDLQELKHKLGVDVRFELPKAKGSSVRAAAVAGKRRRFRGPRVLAFGSLALKQGARGRLHLKIPAWVRRELKRSRRAGHRTIRATLTIDAEVQPGLHTVRTQRVTIRLAKRRGG